jgi:hypothetical protein
MEQIRNIQAERYRRHLEEQAKKARLQKVLAIIEKYSSFTPLDWAAKSIQKLSKCKKSPSEKVVNVNGIEYPFSMATLMIDQGTAPFDEDRAISIYNQVLNKQQNAEHFLSHDFRLSPEDQVLFILSCASKRTQPDILLLVEFFNEVIINELLSLDLSENPELVRKIRTINFLLNGDLPDWIFKHFPAGTNLEEFVPTLIQDIQFELEVIGKKQARLVEVHWRPNPCDEIHCTNCQDLHLARNMHSHPNGSFLYCTTCAPLAGIFPNGFFADDGDF